MAYLKSLELAGFKSFPDKVNISFTDGICAIVGPNGSGKSNICDAIRWVFGEQSAKTLRGDKMEDVIFGGTQTRKPVGFAEVTLTLDNTSGMLKSDYSEISVTRRYYRSGESEYFINRSPVRLKDVHELFMDTGLGRDGYSIIGQGRIAEILSQKSSDRRQIFEEAAGISKYRYKKLESERKLKVTEENLLRLSDIISALSERVGPLEIQSKKAKQYMSLRDRLRELEVTLWLNSSDKIKENEKKFKQDISDIKSELELKTKEASDSEMLLEELYNKQREADIDINTKRTEIQNLKLEIQKRENDITVMKNTVERNTADIMRLNVQSEARRDKSADNNALIKAARERIFSLNCEFEKKNDELNSLISSGGNAAKISSDKLYEIDDIRGKIEEKTEEISGIREKISSLESKIHVRLSQQSNAHDTILLGEKQIDELSLRVKEAESEIEQIKADFSDARKAYASENEALLSVETTLQSYEAKLSFIQKTEAGAQARLSMLTELQNELEGFSNSVKFVMRQSKAGKLSGIEGTTADLFSVDERYTTAIEIALGGAIQNIVTKDEESAKTAIQSLKDASRGRATFLPLTSVRGNVQNFGAITSCKGYIACAAEVIKNDKKYDLVFAYLLGRTALFDNLDNAVAASKKTGYRTRIVTLDGQTINAGGAMTGGSFNKNTGILTRTGEIARLKQECKTRAEEMERLKVSIEESKLSAAKQRSSVQTLMEKSTSLETYLSKKKSELEYLIKSLDDAKVRQSELKAQSLGAAGQMKRDEDEKAKLSLLLTKENIDLDSLRQRLSHTQNEYAMLELDSKQFDKKISDTRLSTELIKKDIDSVKLQLESYERQSGELLRENENFRSDLKRLKRENEELEDKILKETETIGHMNRSSADKDAKLSHMISDKFSLDKEATLLSKKSKELSQRIGELERELVRLETKLESSLSELELIAQKLWDSYELTPVTAEKYRMPREDISQSKAQSLASDLKRQINALGNINLDAIDEYIEVKEKLDFLKSQTDDLVKAKESLESIISGLTRRMKEIFTEQFKLINKNFSETFTELFGGGRAWMELEDEHDVLNCGIEIHVQPPGKNVKSITLLSGGEQAFTAIAVLFAMLKIRPTPFCVFDEVEAALDEVNVTRFARYIESFKDRTQFVVITHRRGTMEFADMLYGVTMQEKGVSKLLSINVRDVAKQMNILQ